MTSHLRIGTRASKLARTQAQMLADALCEAYPGLSVTTVAMTTAGDRELHKKLSDWGYKGLFTRELEDALLLGEIDIAVHSIKDMPSILPDGLTLAAMLRRADMRDAWVSPLHACLAQIPRGATIGTSSARRAAQLLHRRPDIHIVPLRGNVETRLRKLDEGVAEGTFLAAAGLLRLGMESNIREFISPDNMLPAVAQGAVGIECCAARLDVVELLRAINHTPTVTALTAERAFLAALDGSCRTPIAGLAELQEDGQLRLRGEVLSLDGTIRHYHALSGAQSDAALLGGALGEILRARAGNALLTHA